MASNDEMKALLAAPIPMARNTYLHFYNGGKLRAEFGEDNAKITGQVPNAIKLSRILLFFQAVT